MAKSSTPVFPQKALNRIVEIDDTYIANALVTLVNVSSDYPDGAIIKELFASNDDGTIVADITFWISQEGIDVPIGGDALVANAGSDVATPTARDSYTSLITSLANTSDANGNESLRLDPDGLTGNTALKVSLSAAPASGKKVWVAALGESF